MRKTVYALSKNLYSQDEIKQLDDQINEKKESKSFDSPAKSVLKTSEIEFIKYGSVSQILSKFMNYCFSANSKAFGFDLFPVTGDKIMNYNIYKPGTEYYWHIDAESLNPIRDIKLTAMMNCSDEPYEGGELVLFKGVEEKCPEFEIPGSVIVFPAFTNHKVNKVTSGVRKTLALWMWGPKFR